MNRSLWLWILALLITLGSAVYQRMTGPTYPLTGSVSLAGEEIPYRFLRTHGGESDAPVQIIVPDSAVQGVLYWKRFKTDDAWTPVVMEYREGALSATLPNQPPAGKLAYRIELQNADSSVTAPAGDPVVIRFKGEVPTWLIIPHVLAMFGAMLLSTRTGLELFSTGKRLRTLTIWTISLLFAGGFILGPAVQLYAFGAWWTGWPLGTDLTDNKTAVAMVAWIIALVALFRSKAPARWSVAAALVTLIVFLIPHSLLGSELDYKALDAVKQVSSPAPE